jgi:hypothetical protein
MTDSRPRRLVHAESNQYTYSTSAVMSSPTAAAS